ncbi:MAG: hypothetical protein EHM55_11960 [Acidobacteria bacterium]|nr:MAG: hypothetical protein EHM55_11960 [Acidobacteriota bacterium]
MKTSHHRGILTLAFGQQRYVDMAIQLARSIRMNSPNQTLAVVTDRSETDMKPWFDLVIPINPAHGTGMAAQKLDLYDNSPFRETIYIDADCLVVRDLAFLWTLFAGLEMAAIGSELRSGSWAGMDVRNTCSQLAIPYVIQLQGGVYYFRQGDLAHRIFRTARELVARYDELGIARLRGAINDEPLISLAMAMCHQHPVDDSGRGMRTRLGLSGTFEMDVLEGQCRFTKHGTVVEPAIMHFGGRNTNGFYYRREKRKMDLHEKGGLPRRAASNLVNLAWRPLHAALVCRKRLKRRIAALSSYGY